MKVIFQFYDILEKLEPLKSQRIQIQEKDFECYLDFVEAKTEIGRQIPVKDFFYKLGYQKNMDTEKCGKAVLGQYNMAKSRRVCSCVFSFL